MTDWSIENGWIVDGTGAPRFRGSVAVRGGKIAAIAREGEPRPAAGNGETIDAEGLAVCPGFIDMHTHSELAVLADCGHIMMIERPDELLAELKARLLD